MASVLQLLVWYPLKDFGSIHPITIYKKQHLLLIKKKDMMSIISCVWLLFSLFLLTLMHFVLLCKFYSMLLCQMHQAYTVLMFAAVGCSYLLKSKYCTAKSYSSKFLELWFRSYMPYTFLFQMLLQVQNTGTCKVPRWSQKKCTPMHLENNLRFKGNDSVVLEHPGIVRHWLCISLCW